MSDRRVHVEPLDPDSIVDRYRAEDAAREIARLRAEVHRLQHGEATEGDYACQPALEAQAEVDRLRAEVARLTRLRAFDTSAVPLPPGLALEHERLDAMWRQLVAERDHARAEVERLSGKVEYSHYWYGCRWERLRDLLRGTDLESQAVQIMANGTVHQRADGSYVSEPPTYAQQLNIAIHRAEATGAEVTRLTAQLAAADALREAAGAAVHELDPRPLQRALDAYDAARGAR